MMEFELGLLDMLQNIRTPWLDALMVTTTKLGDGGLIWIVLSVILLIYPKTRKVGIACILSLLIGHVLNNLGIKNLVGRLRPFNYSHVVLLIERRTDYSFPSGHTASSFGIFFVLYYMRVELEGLFYSLANRIGVKPVIYVKWSLVAIFILAFLMAFSRLYLYMHFPTDVLVGVFMGWLCAWFAIKVTDRIKSVV